MEPHVNEKQGPPGRTQAVGTRKVNRISAPTMPLASHLCVVPGGCWQSWPLFLSFCLSCLLTLASGRPGLPKHKQAHTQACWWWLVKPDLSLLCTSFVEADICFCNSPSPFISHSPWHYQSQVYPLLTAHASPAVPSLLPASLPAQLLPWSSAGSRAADVRSRMESSLALPCCVGSAQLTEYILVCLWKLNSCSSGTQKADLQRKTTSLFSPANHDHLFCPEKERLHFLCWEFAFSS